MLALLDFTNRQSQEDETVLCRVKYYSIRYCLMLYVVPPFTETLHLLPNEKKWIGLSKMSHASKPEASRWKINRPMSVRIEKAVKKFVEGTSKGVVSEIQNDRR